VPSKLAVVMALEAMMPDARKPKQQPGGMSKLTPSTAVKPP
jgi:hypothetical protein